LTIAYLFVVAIAVALDWWWLAVFSVPAVVTVWVYLDYRRQVANRRASHRDR
jgi:hypothetical protein